MYRLLINDPAVNIFLAILLITGSVFALIFLMRSIKKEKVNYIESQSKNNFNNLYMKEFIRKKIESAVKNTAFTIIILEIYDYKSIKQNFGETQFKNILTEMSERISSLMPDGVKIAEDDFELVIYMKNKYTLNQLDFLSKSILNESQKPFTLVGALKIDIDVNICVASFPESGKTYNELMHNLELTMIVSKRKGINNFIIYDKQISNEETEEYRYYKEIKEAMDNKEFMLYYQPIINLDTKEAIGAESLLRWNHKTLGILPPSKFLHIIEHSGDIYWVGLWAIEQLVRQSQSWALQYPDKKLILTMNLSPKQLINPELANEFRRIIKKLKANPSDFCMEIVEFAMFDKVETIQENILKLRQMGFKIAIDNCGLEFSSLSLIDKLPIDWLKLDREFISKTEENSMTTNIIEVLNRHTSEKKITIIAEGIEKEESLKRLKELNIKYGQGYLFSVPKSPSELITDINMTPWK